MANPLNLEAIVAPKCWVAATHHHAAAGFCFLQQLLVSISRGAAKKTRSTPVNIAQKLHWTSRKTTTSTLAVPSLKFQIPACWNWNAADPKNSRLWTSWRQQQPRQLYVGLCVCLSRALALSLSRALGALGRFLSLSLLCALGHALALCLARAVARKTTTTQFLKRSRAENNVNQEINKLFFYKNKMRNKNLSLVLCSRNSTHYRNRTPSFFLKIKKKLEKEIILLKKIKIRN